MIKVFVNDQDNIDKDIKKFTKICKKDGFLNELRDRKHYKKPSEIRREQVRRYERQLKKKNKKEY